jgi:transmembrane sensor
MSSAAERRARIAEEAAEWLLRLESDSLPGDERAQFVDWLRESPLHVAEMLRVARVRDSLVGFTQWAHIAPLEPTATVSVPTLPVPDRNGEGLSATPRVWQRSRKWLAAAAAVVVAVGIGLAMLVSHPGQSVIRTQLSERRDVSLADGSEVTIAPDSEIHVNLGQRERLIVLARGEAFFHVSKDPRRPFIVDAGHARTRAVGTSFSVERWHESVVVTVVEGRVAVTPSATPSRFGEGSTGGGAEISVGTNEQVAVSPEGRAAPVREVNGQVEIARSQGRLVFDNETVAAVVRRFNLYNRTQIRVTDDAVASRLVSGVFRAADPASFVSFLESAGGINVKQAGPDEILIGSQTAAAPDSPQ